MSGHRINPVTGRKLCGLACLPPEERKRIASIGGSATAARGTYHVNTREQGIANGRKGGLANAARWRRIKAAG